MDTFSIVYIICTVLTYIGCIVFLVKVNELEFITVITSVILSVLFCLFAVPAYILYYVTTRAVRFIQLGY